MKQCLGKMVLLMLKFTEQYKKINPMQQVPAVEIDGITLSQSVSLNTVQLYPPAELCSKHPSDSTENAFRSHSWQRSSTSMKPGQGLGSFQQTQSNVRRFE